MRLAIELAYNNRTYPFGAVLVDVVSGEVVAEGFNRGHENPTWHGEIDAINQFARRRANDDSERARADDLSAAAGWGGLHLYTTAEPCCMCQAAVLWAGIPRVVYGTSIARLQQLGWNQIDIRADEVVRRSPFAACQVQGGILETDCDRLFEEARKRER